MGRPRIVLVSSGLGTALGGIGVVSEMMHRSIARFADVEIWRHDLELGRKRRLASLARASLLGSMRKPDLVLYEHVDLARMSVAAPWLWRARHAVFVHGTEVWRPLSAIARRALESAHTVLSNSAFTVREARRHNSWFPDARVTWLGVERAATVHDRPREKRALLVGRMHPDERLKGHDLVLDAWPLVTRRHPDAQLDIIGDGLDMARLQQRAATLSGVTFRGRVSEPDKNAAYAASSVFLFPSIQEGFGLAAVEAASHGCPPLVVHGTVYDELFPSGSGAVFAPARTAEAIASATGELFDNPSMVRALSERAQQRVNDNFLSTHFEARIEAELKAAIG